jgi:transposase
MLENCIESPQLLKRIRYCHDCFEKQRELDQMKEEVARLRAEVSKLKREKGKLKGEGPFGINTPSSKQPFKKKASKESTQAKGGAKQGHTGHGRQKHSPDEVDNIIEHALPDACPDCGGALAGHGVTERSVLELVRPEVEKIIYRCLRGICKKCAKTHTAKPPVLPRSLYGNELLAQSLDLHYRRGMSLGKLIDFLGPHVKDGGLIHAFHRIARLFEPAISKLREDYRKSMVKHADETGWRTDGCGGYAWLFCTSSICLFEFQDTRSARVVEKQLGQEHLAGVLVVDRYPGYNRVPCSIQYCYAHLLRDIKKLQDEFENQAEVREYTTGMANLLSFAMHLKASPISDKDYYRQAQLIQTQMEGWTAKPFQHIGIRAMQKIFSEKSQRLYHWVTDRRIPCENNYAERQIRKAVLSRKVSFGSQSANGAKTRGTIMSYLMTAAIRLDATQFIPWLKNCLDQMVINPTADPYSLLPKPKEQNISTVHCGITLSTRNIIDKYITIMLVN